MAKLGRFVRNLVTMGLGLALAACGGKVAQTAGPDCVTVPAVAAAPREPRPTLPRISYRPDCGPGGACAAWRAFREDHPYPYQAFAGKALGGGRAVLVLSEPPPEIARAAGLDMLRGAFADRNPEVDARRWMIGSDGYVEDLVVSFDAPDLRGDDLLTSPELRDRIATLQLAWFGTACGGDVETIGDGSALAMGSAPNLQISAAELKRWIDDPALKWLPIDSQAPAALTWAALAKAAPAGAFLAADRSLVLLTFKREMLDDPNLLATLKADFRRFAVSSDAILGVVWTPAGQIAMVGRARTHSLAQIAPLRFETFRLLAAERGNALLQSYERTNPLAGRMWAQSEDWAPIFLSDVLIDTEFGALLNVTDQMLKSWSQHGTVDYLYFDYPLKPRTFPFDKPLSYLVAEKTGSNQTLFNWNTAGSAVTVSTDDMALVVGRQLGSLPVTYGSDAANDGEMETGGHLVGFEDKAYDYFSALGDPNLARVVQYTLLYQAFRSLEGGPDERAASDETPEPKLRPETRMLADQLERLLPIITKAAAGSPAKNSLTEAASKLAAIRTGFPGLSDPDLALLLVDRQDGLQLISEAGRVAVIGADTTDAATARMRVTTLLRAISSLSVSVKDALQRSGLEFAPIRRAFEKASAHPVNGWIRTPSHVVSWSPDGKVGFSIGGHNINAKTLRFEADDAVEGIVATDDGRILYAPAEAERVNAHATEIARAVEHKRASPEELRAIAAVTVADRPRWQALELRGENVRTPAAGRLGWRSYANTGQFVESLRAIKAQVACCRIMGRDATGRSLIVESNRLPPPVMRVMGFGDNASLGMYLRRGDGVPADVIVLDQPIAHIDALLAGASMGSEPIGTMARLRRWLGRTRDTFSAPRDHMLTRDLNDRFGAITTPAERLSVADRMKRIGNLRSETMRGAKVEPLSNAEVGRILESLGWSPQVDGLPTAARLSYQSGKEDASGWFAIVAGFRGPNAGENAAEFRSAIEGALAVSAGKEKPVITVLTTIKNNLVRLRKAEVGRIVFVRQSGTDRIQLTLRAGPAPGTTAFHGSG